MNVNLSVQDKIEGSVENCETEDQFINKNTAFETIIHTLIARTESSSIYSLSKVHNEINNLQGKEHKICNRDVRTYLTIT